MKWNLSNSSTRAIDKESISECGCIHTCQGLEFDYVGVIIGQDLRFEDGKMVTNFFKRAKTDKSLNGVKKLYKEKALKISDELTKNPIKDIETKNKEVSTKNIKDIISSLEKAEISPEKILRILMETIKQAEIFYV